jgi:hypothetical protein
MNSHYIYLHKNSVQDPILRSSVITPALYVCNNLYVTQKRIQDIFFYFVKILYLAYYNPKVVSVNTVSRIDRCMVPIHETFLMELCTRLSDKNLPEKIVRQNLPEKIVRQNLPEKICPKVFFSAESFIKC